MRQRVENALLHHRQLDIQDLAKLVGSKRLEGHDLVEAVYELRRAFPGPGGYSRARHFFVPIPAASAPPAPPPLHTRPQPPPPPPQFTHLSPTHLSAPT